MSPLAITPLDPGAGFEAALNSVTGAINTNQTGIMLVAGGLLAIGVLWKFTRKFVKP